MAVPKETRGVVLALCRAGSCHELNQKGSS
jgi:hypothetical protein